jgi:hypothetical protein
MSILIKNKGRRIKLIKMNTVWIPGVDKGNKRKIKNWD